MTENTIDPRSGAAPRAPRSAPVAARAAVRKRRTHRLAGFAATASLLLAGAGPAGAATPAPGYTIHSLAAPTNFSAADNAGCDFTDNLPLCDAYLVTVRDAGGQATDGSPVTLTDTVPAGLSVGRIVLIWTGPGAVAAGLNGHDLGTISQDAVLCSTTPVECDFPFALQPDDVLRMTVYVTVDDPSASGPLTNLASVSGGGAPGAQATSQNTLGLADPGFGPSGISNYVAGPDGAPDTQAGDHPYELTTLIDVNNVFRQAPDTPFPALTDTSVEDLKDVVVDLPLGFLGSATATPTCTFAQLSSNVSAGQGGCPADTIVGQLSTVGVPLHNASQAGNVQSTIFNMVPEHGVAAEFAFVDNAHGSHALYAHVVPGPDGYVLRVTSPDIPQIPLANIATTFWGNPSDPVHDAARGSASGTTPAAMFTNPASCNGQPLTTAVHMDSWQHPGSFNADGTPNLTDPNWASATSTSPPVTGCNLLHFDPTISVQPDSASADSPSGLDVELKVPQSEDPNTLATPPLRKGLVTLPLGVSVNPAAADGLGACSPAQIDLASASEPSCPDSSKVGTVELQTPLLPGTLTGSVYLATQTDNPFHSLIAGYIVIDDPTTGVVVKIPGNLTPDPTTGQITGVFDNNPQFPFSDLKLHFFGGTRGELATPESCGTYTSTSEFTPWSAPDSGPPATPSDSFTIDKGCVSGFAPSFTAGTMNPQAGAFSPFTLSFGRSDTDQNFQGLSVTLPPGLLAKIVGVGQCSEAQLASISSALGTGAAQAANPSCPASSQLGTVTTGAGVGPSPFFVGGKAYLTGPYKGAPYGLAVVVPALAGPFDLGSVVVRQALYIDPNTAQVTAVSDPFPTILDGIPLRIRRVDVNIDRPSFTLNPTSCEPMAITGNLVSTGGLTAPVSSRFQASGCRELPFKPHFSASTQGKTSKLNGASLTVKVSQKPGEANIHKVTLQLPIALPSRLTTLQKACTEAQFNANPAGCPEGSFIGTATAHTPLLNAPLTGPAILVSHGGAGFPDVEFLLQGEGVHITLDGKTDIKKGITFSRFETVPDAPISSFETVLPEGPHSVLAAFGNLCSLTKTVTVTKHITKRLHGRTIHTTKKVKHTVTQPLVAPTTITGQNGAVVKQTTKIAVSGCAKAKIKRKAKKAAKGNKRTK
jgi:hypothetical protein